MVRAQVAAVAARAMDPGLVEGAVPLVHPHDSRTPDIQSGVLYTGFDQHIAAGTLHSHWVG